MLLGLLFWVFILQYINFGFLSSLLYHCSLKFVLHTLIHNLELFTQQFIQLMSYEYESRDSWAVWIWIWKVMNSHEYESYELWILVNMNQKKPWTHEYESVIVILVNSYESYSSWIIFIWPWTIWILNRGIIAIHRAERNTFPEYLPHRYIYSVIHQLPPTPLSWMWDNHRKGCEFPWFRIR